MDWRRLLCTRRLRARTQGEEVPVRTAFQRDADRVLFSSAFRRLQGKTQVYPLPEDDHVHTRLTHSLEVASVGRSIGNLVGEGLLQRHPELREQASFRDLGDCVHAACLAHDLGNPPFGHSGEDAIRAWFRRWLAGAPGAEAAQALTAPQRQDLCSFEGNAQGFRILTRTEMGGRQGGLQLTLATLAAFTKYPRAAQTAPAAYRGKSAAKLGVYQSELHLFREVAEALGLPPREGLLDGWHRHPLAFLVEAADDVCYLILDLEDGHRIGYVPHELFVELLHPLARRDSRLKGGPAAAQPSREERRAYGGVLRALAINELVGQVARAFLDHEAEILRGELDSPLTDLIPAKAELARIEQQSVALCYRAREVVQIEVAGFEVIGGLLDKLVGALPGSARVDARQLRCLFDWLGREPTLYEQLLAITDYISGMTDSYAVQLYRKLFGHSLPHRGG